MDIREVIKTVELGEAFLEKLETVCTPLAIPFGGNVSGMVASMREIVKVAELKVNDGHLPATANERDRLRRVVERMDALTASNSERALSDRLYRPNHPHGHA